MRRQTLSMLALATLTASALVTTAPAVGAVTEVTDAGDLPATALVIETAETQIDGYLDLDDIDLYRFCVDGGPFSAEVTTYGGSDSLLYLFNANGYYVDYNDDGGYGTLSLLEYADLPAGAYLLAIGDYWSEPNNSPWSDEPAAMLTSWPYTGWATEATGPYTIALDGLSAAPCATPFVSTTDLYAVGYATGGPSMGAPSNLYEVDPNTGDATLIGPITLDETPLVGITGIDFGLDGLLYAADNQNQRLVTIDLTTGEATVVGPYGSHEGWLPDISFDAYGYLYGWDESDDDLVRIDLDGTTRHVGDAGTSTWGTGLAVDSSNTMYVKAGTSIQQVSPQTGQLIGDFLYNFGFLEGYTNNPADFDVDGRLYTVLRPETMGYVAVGSILETLDPVTGLLLFVGHDPDVMITGLAFDTGTTTPLGSSTELDLVASVDDASVAFGDPVTVTLTVTNDGPASADVMVTNLLPPELTYVSDTGAGAYVSGTGVWTVGTLAVDAQASLSITATATGTGWAFNTAVASADIYVPGPVTTSVDVYISATFPGAPTDVAASAGDGRVQVSWTAPAFNGGAAITGYRIYYCTPTPCTAGTGTYVAATTSPATVTGLANGASYGFAVRTVNSVGEGIASATVDATPDYASATIVSAVKTKGKITIEFTPVVPPLETALSTPLTYQVSGGKAGTWVDCTPLTSTTCLAKTSAKSVAIRISTNDGVTWGPASTAVLVTR